jgi:hypothetical protein
VVCQFHIVEVASGEMVESRKMGWKMGENVVVECEGNETSAGEKSRRRDFPLWGITESEVLNILHAAHRTHLYTLSRVNLHWLSIHKRAEGRMSLDRLKTSRSEECKSRIWR